jgi:hypothetical protein
MFKVDQSLLGILSGHCEITLIMISDSCAVKCQRLFQVIDGVKVILTRRQCIDDFAILQGRLIVGHGRSWWLDLIRS